MQLALPNAEPTLKGGFRLPPVVPPFNTRAYRLFSVIWIAVFLLAFVGPLAGFYYRYTSPENNSQLLLGSRAGFAVSPRDATKVRFTVGPASRRPPESAPAIISSPCYGLPLPKAMPFTEEALAEHADDPAYIAMGNVLFGTDTSEVPLTVRDSTGDVREVTVATGEQHIDAGAQSIGISSKMLSFIDLLHVISYPFLLWAAWILHRRNSRDAVSSILSLAVLMTISAEQPSSIFLANFGVPRGLNVALYDLGNVLPLAGIMLFPHGKLSWRVVALLASLPILMFLHGTLYQTCFVGFMIVAVLMLLRCLRQTRIDRPSAADPLGACSALPAMPCCAAFPSPATISNGRPGPSGNSFWSRWSPGLRWRLRCCSSSSACSSLCFGIGFTTPRSSSAGRRISR